MTAGEYLAGALFALATFGAIVIAAEIVIRRRFAQLEGATRLVAWATIATAGILAVHLLAASLTILSRETALLGSLLALAGAAYLPAAAPAASEPERTPGGRSLAESLLAMTAVAGASIWLLYALIDHAAVAPTGFDAANAYFPTAARWLQEGSIWAIADWLPGAFYGSGPGNGSVLVLAAMLPWENDFAAHLAMYPFVVLLVVALYAVAREVGAPQPASLLIALMVAAAPVVVIPGLVDGLLDPVMYATLAVGVLFLLRHSRTRAKPDLVLAGLALGICFGTKFYGYTTVAAVLAVWAGGRLLFGIRLRTVARDLLLAGGIVLAAGGIWMLRNWVETGNPLMPVSVEIAGLTIFDAPADPQRAVLGDTLAGYLDEPRVWFDTLAHQFRIAVGLPLLVALAGAIATTVMLGRRRRAPGWGPLERAVATSLLAAATAVLVYLLTPYSAPGIEEPNAAAINVRYGIPAIILAVPALGWLAARLTGHWSAGLCALALLASVDALRVGTVTRPAVVYVSFAIGALLALAAVRAPVSLPRLPGPRARLAAGAAVALAALVAGYALERDYNADRYRGQDAAIDFVLDRDAGDDGVGVGITGSWSTAAVAPTYPAFGTRLANRVDYVGTTEDGLLRAARTRGAFSRALRRIDPRILLIGRERTSPVPGLPRPTAPETVARWSRKLGFERAIGSERFVVMVRPERRAG